MHKINGTFILMIFVILLLSVSDTMADQTLSPESQGWYYKYPYNGTSYSVVGDIVVGASSAGWVSFDVSGVVPSLVCGLIYSFTQYDIHNDPSNFSIYDVDTPFDDLNVARNPLDEEGLAILTDLHTGSEYGSASAYPSGSLPHDFDITLNQAAIDDLLFEVGSVDQIFSIGMANVNFDEAGWFSPLSPSLTVIECPPPAGLVVDCGVYPVTAGVPTQVTIDGSGFDDSEGMVSGVAVKRGGSPGSAVIDSIISNFQFTTTITAKDGGKLPRTQTLIVTKDNKDSVKCVGSVVVD